MYFNINIVIFLFSLRCITEKEKELIEKLHSFEDQKIRIMKNGLRTKIYSIELYSLEDVRNEAIRKIIQNLREENTVLKKYSDAEFHLLYNKMNELDYLIENLKKETKTFNISIHFYHDNLMEDLQKYIRIFIKKLEENKIKNVMIEYNNFGDNAYYYRPNHVFVELFDDVCTVLEVVRKDCDVYLQKKKISNEYITELMKYNAESYCSDINDPKEKKLFEKYFLNYKLNLIKKNYLLEVEKLLEECSVDKINYEYKNYEIGGKNHYVNPNMKYFNVLFHFLKNSDILRDFIKKSLRSYGSPNYLLFKEILENLGITFFDSYQFLLERGLCVLIPIGYKTDELLRLEIDLYNRIRKLNPINDIENYKKFLIYFYSFLKDDGVVEIDELIKIIKEVILNGYFFKFFERTAIHLSLYSVSNANYLSQGVNLCYESEEIRMFLKF